MKYRVNKWIAVGLVALHSLFPSQGNEQSFTDFVKEQEQQQ